MITREAIIIEEDKVRLTTPHPYKVVSSAMHNAGIGYYTHFLNRAVPYTYDERQPHQELEKYMVQHHFPLEQTVAMMTAVYARFAVVRDFRYGEDQITVMITAGLGNAVDITRAIHRQEAYHAGTINMWVFIHGKLSDEALLQALISATEAKSKALYRYNIRDRETQTLATGTSTDSVLIASSQQGRFHQYAGPITTLGKLVGYGVYETMCEAIRKYLQDKAENPI